MSMIQKKFKHNEKIHKLSEELNKHKNDIKDTQNTVQIQTQVLDKMKVEKDQLVQQISQMDQDLKNMKTTCQQQLEAKEAEVTKLEDMIKIQEKKKAEM